MPNCLFCCSVDLFSSKEELIGLLLSEEHHSLLEAYREILEEDPDYLRFHATSTALRLQCALKTHNLPSLRVGTCPASNPRGCCMLEVLEGALKLCPVRSATNAEISGTRMSESFAVPRRRARSA